MNIYNKYIVLIILIVIITIFIINFDVYVVSKNQPLCKPIYVSKRELTPDIKIEQIEQYDNIDQKKIVVINNIVQTLNTIEGQNQNYDMILKTIEPIYLSSTDINDFYENMALNNISLADPNTDQSIKYVCFLISKYDYEYDNPQTTDSSVMKKHKKHKKHKRPKKRVSFDTNQPKELSDFKESSGFEMFDINYAPY